MYQIITGRYILEEESYISYGIRWGYDKIDRIEDISLDREAIEALVNLCNFKALSPIHLQDIVTDFLAAPEDIQWETGHLPGTPAFPENIRELLCEK